MTAGVILTLDTLVVGVWTAVVGQSNTSPVMPLPGITVHPADSEQIAPVVSDIFKIFAKHLPDAFHLRALILIVPRLYH